MTRILTASGLGDVAENTFRSLCGRGQLVCNKSDRDLVGWDFDVQFPMPDPSPGHSLDQRAAMSCRVQLKATATQQGERVTLKLSAAELLAKGPGPALICVLRMTPLGEPVAGYLIHLLGANLAFVLHRLRRAEADDRLDVHRLSITFDAPRRGVRFSPTPEGLRGALVQTCGSDPTAYGAEKRRQLEELGFDDNRFQIEAVIDVGSEDELADIAVGRRPATAVALSTFEARFGISLPLQQMPDGETTQLLLMPEAVADATVTIRSGPMSPPAVFKGQVMGTPLQLALSDNVRKSLIQTPDLDVTIGAGEMNIETRGDVDGDRRTLAAWANRLRGLVYLGGECADVAIGIGAVEARFTVPVTTRLTGPYLADLPRLLAVAEDGILVLRQAGIVDDQLVGLSEIYGAGRDMYAASNVLLRKPPTAHLSFESVEPERPPHPLKFLFVNHGTLGPHAFAYCASVVFERAPGEAPFTPTLVEPLDLRTLPIEDFPGYAAQQRIAHGMQQLLVREILPPVPGAIVVLDHDLSIGD